MWLVEGPPPVPSWLLLYIPPAKEFPLPVYSPPTPNPGERAGCSHGDLGGFPACWGIQVEDAALPHGVWEAVASRLYQA